MESIRTYFFNRFLRSHLRLAEATPLMLDWTNIRTIGIILRADTPSEITLLEKFTGKLHKAGKKVQTCLIRSNADAQMETDKFNILNPKDFNWQGIIKSEAINLLPSRTDLLISAGDPLDRQFISCIVKCDARIKITNQVAIASNVDLVVPSDLNSKINTLRSQLEVIKSLSPKKEPAGI